jgi:hypothetical protein
MGEEKLGYEVVDELDGSKLNLNNNQSSDCNDIKNGSGFSSEASVGSSDYDGDEKLFRRWS